MEEFTPSDPTSPPESATEACLDSPESIEPGPLDDAMPLWIVDAEAAQNAEKHEPAAQDAEKHESAVRAAPAELAPPPAEPAPPPVEPAPLPAEPAPPTAAVQAGPIDPADGGRSGSELDAILAYVRAIESMVHRLKNRRPDARRDAATMNVKQLEKRMSRRRG